MQPWLRARIYQIFMAAWMPLNYLRAFMFRRDFEPRSVVHVGEVRPLILHLVSALKKNGIKATYIGVGERHREIPCDVYVTPVGNPIAAAIRDLKIFWSIVATYEIVHLHCGIGITPYLFELPLLKLMGRQIIFHFRGCEARTRHETMMKSVDLNICQNCDYAPNYICESRQSKRRRRLARKYADTIVVTTPDLKVFWPDAVYLPLIAPNVSGMLKTMRSADGSSASATGEQAFRVVHITNQPGIEGTALIKQVCEDLNKSGRLIQFIHVKNEPYDVVLSELAKADVSVGKLKMGYYANAQIESMAVGTPVITRIHEDFLSEDLLGGGIFLTSLKSLPEVLCELMDNPDKLEEAGRLAPGMVERLHGEKRVVDMLKTVYGFN